MADVASTPGWLARLWARLAGTRDASGRRLRAPFVRHHGDFLSLQFGRSQTQSRMRLSAPDALLIDYTRTMLGALVLRPDARCIGMVGLGGGSQVKFCHRHLPAARVEVAEHNPGVIALRRRFGIPDDDARLAVVADDGARFVAARPGRYDLLLVDGYDETGIPPVLSTQAFYDNCARALTPGGVLACNLFATDAARHVDRLRAAFGPAVLVLEEAKMRNRVAIAWRRDGPAAGLADVEAALAAVQPPGRAELAPVFERVAQALSARRSPGAG